MRVTYGPTPRYQMSAVTSQSLQVHAVTGQSLPAKTTIPAVSSYISLYRCLPTCQSAQMPKSRGAVSISHAVSHKFRESASTRRTLADCRNQPIYISIKQLWQQSTTKTAEKLSLQQQCQPVSQQTTQQRKLRLNRKLAAKKLRLTAKPPRKFVTISLCEQKTKNACYICSKMA